MTIGYFFYQDSHSLLSSHTVETACYPLCSAFPNTTAGSFPILPCRLVMALHQGGRNWDLFHRRWQGALCDKPRRPESKRANSTSFSLLLGEICSELPHGFLKLGSTPPCLPLHAPAHPCPPCTPRTPRSPRPLCNRNRREFMATSWTTESV